MVHSPRYSCTYMIVPVQAIAKLQLCYGQISAATQRDLKKSNLISFGANHNFVETAEALADTKASVLVLTITGSSCFVEILFSQICHIFARLITNTWDAPECFLFQKTPY